MIKTSKTIVFFGSGPVAAKSLELLAQDFQVEAVVTKPAKNSRDAVPVIEVANKLDLPVLTPTNKTELEQLFKSRPFTSKAGVLIDYGIIVPQEVIDYFPLGIVNSHFSLLPEWRGADPITFSLLSGQSKTGVSLMLINAAMDEGLLIAQSSLEIEPSWTGPELTEQLIQLSNDMLKKELPLYLEGSISPYEQDQTVEPTYSRKLTKDDGILDWNKSAKQLNQEIKAYIDWPKSHANIKGSDVIITKAHVISVSGQPGSVSIDNKELLVFCGEGALAIDRLKPLGKNDMDARSFIAGYIS